jgi:Uma2 family endonuclease
MPPGGGGASIVAARLLIRLGAYVEDHVLGELTDAQGGYDFSALGQPDTVLAPDVAFVRSDRLPYRESAEYTKAWPLAPDLVAEVAAPTQYRPGLTAKAQRYLAAGVRLVWVIWPQRRQVDVWRPGDIRPSITLEITGRLDGLDVVPGFTFPVAALFR